MMIDELLKKFQREKYFKQAQFLNYSLSQKNDIESGRCNLENVNAIFDVASLTKVLVTGLAAFSAIEQGLIDPHQPIKKYNFTLHHLLSHTSGLESWFPLYLLEKTQHESFWQLALSRAQKPGKRVYSDLGFIFLGKILENALGKTLDVWFEQAVLRPLMLSRTGYAPQLRLKNIPVDQFVPTSTGNPFEKLLAQRTLLAWKSDLEKSGLKYSDPLSFLWREYQLRGECNDFNAFCLSEIAPHAGLFTTMDEMKKIVVAWLEGKWGPVENFKKLFFQGLDETLFSNLSKTLQWGSLDGELYGHHGFTGCSLAIKNDLSQALFFCSNRQFYGLNSKGDYPPWKEILQLNWSNSRQPF